MGYFNTGDNRWKAVRFKKTVIAGYALFIVLAAALVLRIFLAAGQTVLPENLGGLVGAAAGIVVLSFVAAYVIWRKNRQRGWLMMDMLYPAVTYAACGVVLAMHIWMLTF